jgi:multiple sugar transport system substrate-binding protein
MRRTLISTVAGLALVAAAACTPASAPAPVATPGVEPTGSIEFWHFFTDREAKAIDQIVADFRSKYPKVTVTVKSGQDDGKVLQAIGAGKGPDVGLSYSTDIVGKFCSSGAWLDLKQYIDRDKIDLNQFPQTVRSYTEYKGKRCAMPFLADAYGFYYNKKALADAGLAGPPKTLTELADMAKKLTKRRADGSLERVGFMPLFGTYETNPTTMAPMVGAKWLKDDGTSAVGSDPAWQELLKWQKDLVDWYGYANLSKFRASMGDEFSPDNAFHKGTVAMAIDGEYRIAFLRDQAKNLQFGTAPLPVSDAHPEWYGAGYVTGNVVGVAKTSKNPEAAWAMIRYFTTNKDAIVKLANLIKNIPTTTEALAAPGDLANDQDFKTFLDIFQNPNSRTTPPSSTGPQYQEAMGQWLEKWQAGTAPDLTAGLKSVDSQIDQLLKLGG